VTEGAFDTVDPAAHAAPPGGGRDLFSKFDALIGERQALLDTGVRDPFGLVMEKVLSPTRAIISGKETILLGTYNYMGMTFDPDVVAAGKQALDEYGSGTTGSRVLNGTYQGHAEVEAALREFYDMDHAMVFSTGYQANLGLMSTIAGKEDYIILDADSHASIYDGCFLGDAQIVRFRHNSVEDWRSAAAAAGRCGQAGRARGRLFDARRHRAAGRDGAGRQGRGRDDRGRRGARHGLLRRTWPRRVRGSRRRGRCRLRGRHILEERGHGRRLRRIQPPEVRSAAAGLPPVCLHRFAAAERGRNRGHLDPQADACAGKARAPVEEQPRLHAALRELGFDLATPDAQSAIIAVLLPDQQTTVVMWQALLESGLYVNMARPPATPTGTFLLRCSLCAEHSDEEVGRIIDIFTAAGKAMGVIDG
jgi:7-keto-8-aminopelargonate synthetase-like enzyme